MIRDWYRMKREEIKMKLVIYSYVNKFIENKNEIIKLAFDLFGALKDIPVDELERKFIAALAEVAHKSTHKKVDE